MKNNNSRTFSEHPEQAGGRDAVCEHRLHTMIGCASIGLDEQGLSAARLWHRLCRKHLVEERWRVERCGARLLGVAA